MVNYFTYLSVNSSKKKSLLTETVFSLRMENGNSQFFCMRCNKRQENRLFCWIISLMTFLLCEKRILQLIIDTLKSPIFFSSNSPRFQFYYVIFIALFCFASTKIHAEFSSLLCTSRCQQQYYFTFAFTLAIDMVHGLTGFSFSTPMSHQFG